MANHERPNLKQIRIKQSVCARLDERKGKDDSYTDVVQGLLDENARLKERNVELKQDKQDLIEIAKGFKKGLESQPVYVHDEPKRETPQKQMDYLKNLNETRGA